MYCANLVERIRRLLALSTSSNQNEAAAAAAAAQRLMTQHQIEMAQVQSLSDDAFSEIRYRSRGAYRVWRGLVMSALMEANSCTGYRMGNQHAIIGVRTDVQVVHYVFEYLCAERAEAWMLARHKLKKDARPTVTLNAEAHDAGQEAGGRIPLESGPGLPKPAERLRG